MAAEGFLGVAEVGRRTGLSRKALRHYETLGLIEPAARTEPGYRLYDDEALRRIELVKRAKVLGLSLSEAKEFLHVAEGCCGDNHPQLAALVAGKLDETERRIAELHSLHQTLQGVLDRLDDAHLVIDGCDPDAQEWLLVLQREPGGYDLRLARPLVTALVYAALGFPRAPAASGVRWRSRQLLDTTA